jgi:hypothetical protein
LRPVPATGEKEESLIAGNPNPPFIVVAIGRVLLVLGRIFTAIGYSVYCVFWLEGPPGRQKQASIPVIAGPVYPVHLLAKPVEDATEAPWLPATNEERAVAAAFILAGGPVTNGQLAELMGCSPGEASKRVKALGDVIRKDRLDGRTVQLSIPHLINS